MATASAVTIPAFEAGLREANVHIEWPVVVARSTEYKLTCFSSVNLCGLGEELLIVVIKQ
jgi:hypothetical protein